MTYIDGINNGVSDNTSVGIVALHGSNKVSKKGRSKYNYSRISDGYVLADVRSTIYAYGLDLRKLNLARARLIKRKVDTRTVDECIQKVISLRDTYARDAGILSNSVKGKHLENVHEYVRNIMKKYDNKTL